MVEQQTSQILDDGRSLGNRGSTNSGSTSVISKSTSGQKVKRSAQEVTDRKKIKVLKQALKDERNSKQSLQEELDVVKLRNRELAKENESMSNKYLAMYEENDKLQELLSSLKSKIQSAEKDGSLQSDLAELTAKFSSKKS